MFPFPQYYQARPPVAPVRRGPPRPNLGNRLAGIEQMLATLNLNQAQRVRSAPPPRRRPQRPKRNPAPKPQPQKKRQPPRKKAPEPKKKAPKKKPGKKERAAMKLEADRVFEVKDGDQVTGYATAVSGMIMYPLHVKGSVNHPDLRDLSYKSSTALDIKYAPLPTHMKTECYTYGEVKNEGFYTWHHGPVQYDGKFTIPTGKGKPGDSGRPITGNDGKILAIVLGGENQGERTALSVLYWKKGTAKIYKPEAAVQWSAASLVTSMCLLSNISFPCTSPPCMPCCYEKDPVATLAMLEANSLNPGYNDLLTSALSCKPTRAKRSANVSSDYDAYKATMPYTAFCPQCTSRSCQSPVAIESVEQSQDGLLKIQLSCQFHLTAEGTFDPSNLRYLEMTDHLVKNLNISSFALRTSGDCTIINAIGYHVIARCPSGPTLTASIPQSSCTVPYSPGPVHIGRERFTTAPEYGVPTACTTFNPADVKGTQYMSVHSPPAKIDNNLSRMNNGKVEIDVIAGHTTIYQCLCDRNYTGTINVKATINGCTSSTQCKTKVGGHTKWHYDSPTVARDSITTPTARVPIPFDSQKGTCKLPLAPQPIVTNSYKRITLELHPVHPTLLTARRLGAKADPFSEWISSAVTRNFTVGVDGLEYQWGNNAPVRLWAQESATGDPHGHPHEVVQYYYQKHPLPTILVISASALFICLSLGALTCSYTRLRSLCLDPYRLAPNAAIPTCLALMCCIRPSNASTFPETMGYLWYNNQEVFWCQLLIPVAALIIFSKLLKCILCCKCLTFLVIAGAALKSAGAYEHTAQMPNQVGVPYKALVNRPGFAPFTLVVSLQESAIIPSLNLEYTTCNYKTKTPSPYINCCGSAECSPSFWADYHCKAFSGVYPFLWGGAHCFCDSENTQLSEAYVTKSPECPVDHALAYKAHTASVKARVKVSYGDRTAEATAFVNGITSVQVANAKLLLGPISNAWSPFDPKIVVHDGKIYNYDFPEFGAPRAGSFGDIQMRTLESNDMVANTNLNLLRPEAGKIHVPYTQSPSGYQRWKRDTDRSLADTAPFGCKFAINPVRALNCAVGSIPFSIDIPDSEFTRVVEMPSITSLVCSVSECTHSSDFGGVATLTFKTSKAGSCAIHTTASSVTIQQNSAALTAEQTSYGFHFSTTGVQPEFYVTLCGARAVCNAACKPPKDHIVDRPTQTSTDFGSAISSTAWWWLSGLLGTVLSVLGVATLVVILYCLLKPNQQR